MGYNYERWQTWSSSQKRGRLSINSGRKNVSGINASTSTSYRRANDLANNEFYTLEILQLAVKLKKKKISTLDISDDSSDDSQPNNVESKKHTGDSALAFYLENEFLKATYAALVSDSRARKCPIYPNYKELQKAMTRCLPENIKGNEVEVVISLQSTLFSCNLHCLSFQMRP